MSGQNLAIANVILKDVYGDINDQINNATPALDGIKSSARNITQVGGLGVITLVLVQEQKTKTFQRLATSSTSMVRLD